MKYGFPKTVDMPFEKAIEKITEELKKEGFGVLTEIDKETFANEVQGKLQRALDAL